MNKLKNILISGTLSICMVVTSLPIESLAKEAISGQEENEVQEHDLYEIVSFEELTEEVSYRHVPVGTELEELELPESLTVSYHLYTEMQDSGGEEDKSPEDNSGEEENKKDPGSVSGNEGTESNPEDESGEEGNESSLGGGSENEGTESGPGDDTGEEGNEGDAGDEGNKSDPGGEFAEGGNGSNSGDDVGDEENKSNPGGESGEESNESDSGAGSENEGTESSPDTESGEERREDNFDAESEDKGDESSPGAETIEERSESEPGGNSVDGAVMVQNTVEVHMEEYKSQPESTLEPEILIPDGQETQSEENVATDQEADGETDSDSDRESEPDAETGTEVSANGDNDVSQSIETAVIENITWLSAPEYDGNTEGYYIFTPVLPEDYILGDGVALPEIAVTVGEGLMLLDVTEAAPACETISTDTVWGAGTLSDGELIVEPGVTLTLNNCIDITRKVTIKGGGTIKRGNAAARFRVNSGADLTVGEITLEGSSILTSNAMIYANNAKILLDDGCRIQNCHKNTSQGAALAMHGGEAVLNNVIIEGCCGVGYGGTITLDRSVMTVNSGTYRNNRDTGSYAGSVIYNMLSKLYIFGGKFINNTAEGNSLSGCILDTGATQDGFSSETHIYGGYFEGNKKASQGFGGGAILFSSSYSAYLDENVIFELSGDVRFCGDGMDGSGTDGFFLDFDKFPRKVSVGSPITSPVYIHLKAKEGYVIAKGSDNGYILTEKDMKQIHFTDEEDSKKQWYAWLDKENNEIYLSEKKPPYGLYVYYSSNGAMGKVEDNTEYTSGADVTVKSADVLSMEGYKFKEWNTRPDGTGTPYSPGSSFEITDDITLYAIFTQSGTINARFYSGGAGRKEVKSEVLVEDAGSVTITAPELKDMGDWEKVGWDEDVTGYRGSIKPDDELTLEKDKDYYGVYRKDVTLSYDANGGKDVPGKETEECWANVHDEITYRKAGFSVAGKITTDQFGWEFVEWNTRQDGTGNSYSENDIIEITEDTTLYATFVRLPYATFYSGEKGEPERKGTNVVTGEIIAPNLQEKSGWNGIGWDEDEDPTEYKVSKMPGEKITIEDDKDYYGVYEKTVTLSYIVSGSEYEVGSILGESTQTRKAKAGKSKIFYESEPDNPDAFVFEIASDSSMDGYAFLGWNTSADGEGDFYRENDAERNKITITEDTVLYGIFGMPPFATFYSGSAGEYVIVPSAIVGSRVTGMLRTPELKKMEGWEPVGWSRSDTGYNESVEIKSGADLNITEDSVYYGVYEKTVELTYDGNGWLDSSPDLQRGLCYANVHDEITCTLAEFVVGQDISREGYTFRGWSLVRDAGGLADNDFYKQGDPVTLENSATLYAQMVDDIAPVLGEAIYNDGSHNVKDWIVHKKDLVITVPVTEKGSGVDKIVYTFTPESGEPVTGEALMENAGEPEQARQPQAVWLEADAAGTSDGGINITSVEDIRNGAVGRAGTSSGEVGLADGQIQAKIIVSEDYKGSISLMCKDNAGNESPFKLLSAQEGGVIVEDNAPLISFQHKGSENDRAVVEVTVYDNVDEDSNSHITGGIASVSYQTDNEQTQSVTDKDFEKGIVETCTFDVEVSGVGEHTILVTAMDNAGNESSRSTSLRIARDKKTAVIKTHTAVVEAYAPLAGENSAYEPPAEESIVFEPPVETPEPELPTEKEPKTGAGFPHVEIYATMAMISGLLYVVLYFIPEQGGMTESDKNEVVARLIAWAKRGGKLRRYVALAMIFCVLVYYHSIGKSLAEDLKMSDGTYMRRLNLWVMRTEECRTQAEKVERN